MRVVSVCLSPGFQRSVLVDALRIGEVNRLSAVHVDVSGKGINVARVLGQLGQDCLCVGQGGDNAPELLALASMESLDLRLVQSSGRLRTCTSIIETSLETGHTVTELVEPSPPVEPACIVALTELITQNLSEASCLVIAGSMAPGFPLDYQARLVALARQADVPVLLDIQGQTLCLALDAQPSLIKINLSEFANTFLPELGLLGEHHGMLAEHELAPSVLASIATVAQKNETTFVLTRGAQSVIVADPQSIRIFPVPVLAKGQVINPIGSGDAFMAGLVAGVLGYDAGGRKFDFAESRREKALALAVACAQSNARTARPGFLDESFLQSL